MALYEKTQAPLVVDEDADGKAIKFWRHLSGAGNSNHCTVDLPGLGPDDGLIADFLPLSGDRTALKALLDKVTAASLARRGCVVKP